MSSVFLKKHLPAVEMTIPAQKLFHVHKEPHPNSLTPESVSTHRYISPFTYLLLLGAGDSPGYWSGLLGSISHREPEASKPLLGLHAVHMAQTLVSDKPSISCIQFSFNLTPVPTPQPNSLPKSPFYVLTAFCYAG